MRQVSFDRSFSAAHRIWNDESACSRIHGHNYRVTVVVRARLGWDDALNQSGFIVGFDVVKQVIDQLDHRLLIHAGDPHAHVLMNMEGLGVRLFAEPPSTENLAQWLATQLWDALPPPVESVKVFLRENDSIMAEAEAA